MLRIGIVGFGFMGRMHFRQWKAIKGAQVVAICDANPNIKEDTKRAVGNIKGAEGEIDFTGIELYQDFEQMLDKGKLDAISLTLPTYLHAECSEKALSRGVNVLCEKPMALKAADCDRMIQAAQQERQGPPDRALRAVLAGVRQGQGDRGQRQVRQGGRRRCSSVSAPAGMERGQLVRRREPQRRRRARSAHPRHGLRAVPLRDAQGRVQPRSQGAQGATHPHRHRVRVRRGQADRGRGRLGDDA